MERVTAKQNSSLKLQSKDVVSQEYTLISLTNVSDEVQAAPQAFPTHVDMAQALVGKNFGQMRVSGKARGSCELPSKMHWKGEESLCLLSNLSDVLLIHAKLLFSSVWLFKSSI